jgi:hypothetical protein
MGDPRPQILRRVDRKASGSAKAQADSHHDGATRNGPSPGAGPDVESAFEKMAATITTRTIVPRISLSRFAPVLRILGVVQKHARLRNASGV